MSTAQDQFEPGTRVTVTQQIVSRSLPMSQPVTGTVVRYEQSRTGSWFAHAKDNQLWLDRLVLRMDDGETVVLNLDAYSHVARADA
ncbi:hypothetical protein [Mucisphaera calidilacus]|uniref:Uncharacterized protein n=1 Tax=Mucisphaera calidilacus TaxID=2527982 RepID=A0A518BYF1_9BACT|nr:hypothetical protein [Mucisphaera calidilacus]QDU72003.1 hypothetical protein Pan265_18620 [Mucisphaera calidilacus]